VGGREGEGREGMPSNKRGEFILEEGVKNTALSRNYICLYCSQKFSPVNANPSLPGTADWALTPWKFYLAFAT